MCYMSCASLGFCVHLQRQTKCSAKSKHKSPFLERSRKNGELLGLEWGMVLKVSNIFPDENSGVRCQFIPKSRIKLWWVSSVINKRDFAVENCVNQVIHNKAGLKNSLARFYKVLTIWLSFIWNDIHWSFLLWKYMKYERLIKDYEEK